MSNSRYIKQEVLPQIGLNGQEKLGHSSVAIIGAGGLGIPVALYLAGAGIGKITIIDDDSIDLSNLHRQVIYTEDDLNQKKVLVLARHLKKLNREIKIQSFIEKLDQSNALELLNESDVVVDCSDNLHSRYIINDACIILDKAFVSASIFKNEGQLSVFNFKNGPSYRCLYKKEKNSSDVLSCEESGVLGSMTGYLGSMQANEVLKCILDDPHVLSGKLLVTNILNYQSYVTEIDRKESEIKKVKELGIAYDTEPSDNSLNLSKDQLGKVLIDNNYLILDVREEDEFPKIQSDALIEMPSSLGLMTEKLDAGKTIICLCKSGLRSEHICIELRNLGFVAFNVPGGIDTFEKVAKHLLNQEMLK